MGLVDYSSSDSEADQPSTETPTAERPSKRRRTTTTAADAIPVLAPDSASALPPLPSAFHDLYASTVRPSPGDDPSLHQGRRRQIPHVAGHWPSHIYVEWHPPPAAHALLRALLSALDAELRPLLLLPSSSSSAGVNLSSFLTSDLGAPLPLHVSLSRPFVLRTEEKDAFPERLGEAVRGCGAAPFELRAPELAWHRSPDSNRSFLVLRVRSSNGGGDSSGREAGGPRNRELVALLDRCNKLVASYGQPTLYQQTAEAGDGGGSARDAFHISVAWSFAEPTAELKEKTAAVFARDEFREAIPNIPVLVNSIKVKIGNVVTNITLKGYDKKGDKSGQRKSLFGV